MEFELVVYDKNEDGEDRLVTPFSVLNGLSSHLFINKEKSQNPMFIWANTRGEIDIPLGVALRPGWRPVAEADDVKSSIPKKLTLYLNH